MPDREVEVTLKLEATIRVMDVAVAESVIKGFEKYVSGLRGPAIGYEFHVLSEFARRKPD